MRAGLTALGNTLPSRFQTCAPYFIGPPTERTAKRWEHFQGKSVLMSHQSYDGETQGTGFYGINERCQELEGRQVPGKFRVLTRGGSPVQGTSLTIAGFRADPNWRRNIAASVIGNFFHAIHSGALTVTVEPDTDSELLDIDHESLESWFNDLLENEDDPDAPEDENEGVLRQAYIFSQIIKEDTPNSETQDADLGHCRLWVRGGRGSAEQGCVGAAYRNVGDH